MARGSSGTYINISGVLTTATTNTARFNYDANYPRGNLAPSLIGPFLLVEPAATNLLTQSNAFTNAAWTPANGAVVTATVFTSPDGTMDGSSMTSGTGFSLISESTPVTAQAYTMSVWASNIIGSSVLSFQLNSTTVLFQALGTIRRWTGTLTPSAGNNAFIYNNAGSGSTEGLFGSQLETGSVGTSYIATTTTTASRSADVVTFTQPVGCGHNTYTFDDNSTQTVTQAAGSATVPTTLNRPNIKFIDGAS